MSTRTTISSKQIRDGQVSRDDLNVTEPGQAVVSKIIAGDNVTITETGADTGTGDVTVNAELDALEKAAGRTISYAKVKVPNSGVLFLGFEDSIPHTLIPIIIDTPSVILGANIAVDVADGARTYAMALYSNMRGTPVFETDLVTLTAGNTEDAVPSLTLALPVGEYGIGVRKTGGSGGSSDFGVILGTVFIVEQ